MKRFMDKCRRRLKNRGGETITEVLVALLISALALTMLAAMVASASRMVDASRDSLDAYYKAENGLAASSGAPSGTGRATLSGEETGWDVTYYSNGNGAVSYQLS